MHTLKYLEISIVLYSLICIQNGNAKRYAKSYEGYKLFSILPENSHDLKFISNIVKHPKLDVWKSTKALGVSTEIMVPPELQKQLIKKLNSNLLKYNITIDNIQRAINTERREQNTVTTKDSWTYDVQKFYRYSEVVAYLKYLEKTYPTLLKLIPIGASTEGRTLYVVHISDQLKNKTQSKNPAILLDGGTHAREWVSVSQILYIIHQLIEQRIENWDLTKDIDWYLHPIVNPDGYEYTFTKDRLWRKTRSKVSNHCYGVDPNRNYNFAWKYSPPCSETFPGNRSHSEPEIYYLTKFAFSIRNQLKLYFTFHSFSEVILFPWSYTTFQHPDNYIELNFLGRMLSEIFGRNYKFGLVGEFFSNAYGSSLDWFKGYLGVDLVFCAELSPDMTGEINGVVVGFLLPADKVEGVVRNGFNGIKFIVRYVKRKYLKQHTNIISPIWQ